MPDIEELLDIPPWEWPENTGKRFLKALTDRRAKESERLAAAELAGNLVVMNDDLADALMAVLRADDESEAMRVMAAISLGPCLEEADTQEFDPDIVPISKITFHKIKALLHELYLDDTCAKELRRRVLEASVRAPEEWHKDAIRKAYSSGDREWMLTAVFAMRWVRGFEDQILEALESGDSEIHYEAVNAAGNWQLDAAWPHVAALVKSAATPKPLLLAAIAALVYIRPEEAEPILEDLADSEDEEIAEAVDEALSEIGLAKGHEEEDDEDEESDSWVN
jgi:hypothetical protein